MKGQSTGFDLATYLETAAVGCEGLPDSRDALMKAGQALVDRREYPKALNAFVCALRKDPDDPVCRSYLGLCLAASAGGLGDGLKLCESAVTQQFFRPEPYLNLARVYFIAGSRRKAFHTLQEGLRVDPENQEILRERRRLSTRRPPVFPFLRRKNTLNVVSGRVRRRLRSK